MYFVYLLESIPSGRYYIGQTCTLDDRIEKHNKGYVISTNNYAPWKLIGSITVQDRKKAMNLEKKIKGLKKRERQLRYFQKSLGSEK